MPDTTPRFRVGRSVGRTLYAQLGDEPSKSDTLIGVLDTRALSSLVAAALNDYTAARLQDPLVATAVRSYTERPLHT